MCDCSLVARGVPPAEMRGQTLGRGTLGPGEWLGRLAREWIRYP